MLKYEFLMKAARWQTSPKNVRRILLCLAAVSFVITLLACWIIPYRLRYGPGGSYYTFGYVGDEYLLYAAEVQPLIEGTTATNPLNGVCDETLISQTFLVYTLRLVLTLFHIDVIVFSWIWRILFPVVLGLACYFLSKSCLLRTRRLWTAPLSAAMGSVAFAALYFVYDILIDFPPLQGFINRIPSGIEYPLSLLLAACFVRFLKRPAMGSGVVVSVISLALVYFRPYAGLPWGLAIIAAMLHQTITRAVSFRTAAVMLLVVILGMAPWIAIGQWNKASNSDHEQMARLFVARPYGIHPKILLYLSLGLAFGGAGSLAGRDSRVFLFSCAGTMLALPFICGLLSIRNELLLYDRFGCFYLVVLVAAILLIVSRHSLHLSGYVGLQKASLVTIGLAACALAFSGVLASRNFRFDFYSQGSYRDAVIDSQYVPAYKWLRENSASDALFLVGEGFDYANFPADASAQYDLECSLWGREEDLFSIVARRRRVYCEHMRGLGLSNDDLYALAMLHRGTLGLPVDIKTFRGALEKFRPSYIFWRKLPAYPITSIAPAIPRGYGKLLRSTIVYEDSVCVICKIKPK